MAATNVKRITFLRLNKEGIPEVSALMAVTSRQKALAVEKKYKVEGVQTAVAGKLSMF